MSAQENKDLLQQWVTEADRHWKAYLPEKYKALKEAGELEEALQLAAEQTAEEVDEFLDSGYPMRAALEIVKPRYLILDPAQHGEPEEEEELTEQQKSMQEALDLVREVRLANNEGWSMKREETTE